MVETCPLFNDLHWINHRFFGGGPKGLCGIQKYAQFDGLVFFLPQMHTDIVMSPDDPLPESGADASITDKTGMGLAIKTADCVPLLLACTKTRIIGAAHAGWAGALNRISQKTIARMRDLGADPASIRAALGPHIHKDTFPVGPELRERFIAEMPETDPFFMKVGDKFCMDLGGIIAQQLRETGVTQIWQSGINTFASPDHHSYRRHYGDPNGAPGSNISVIMRTV